jgi:hypothetical protein
MALPAPCRSTLYALVPLQREGKKGNKVVIRSDEYGLDLTNTAHDALPVPMRRWTWAVAWRHCVVNCRSRNAAVVAYIQIQIRRGGVKDEAFSTQFCSLLTPTRQLLMDSLFSHT